MSTENNNLDSEINEGIRWKIDEAEDLPLAVIEDTEDGEGVLEIGERTPRNLAIAKEIVESHNQKHKVVL